MVTIGDGKYHSLGLDLDLYSTMNTPDFCLALGDVHKLLARLITFPLVTVSAINGEQLENPISLLCVCVLNTTLRISV